MKGLLSFKKMDFNANLFVFNFTEQLIFFIKLTDGYVPITVSLHGNTFVIVKYSGFFLACQLEIIFRPIDKKKHILVRIPNY